MLHRQEDLAWLFMEYYKRLLSRTPEADKADLTYLHEKVRAAKALADDLVAPALDASNKELIRRMEEAGTESLDFGDDTDFYSAYTELRQKGDSEERDLLQFLPS